MSLTDIFLMTCNRQADYLIVPKEKKGACQKGGFRMKRIVIVCFIMVGIIATGVGSLVHLIRVSDEMDQMLSEVAQAIDRDDLEDAASIADQFSSAWEKK